MKKKTISHPLIIKKFVKNYYWISHAHDIYQRNTLQQLKRAHIKKPEKTDTRTINFNGKCPV